MKWRPCFQFSAPALILDKIEVWLFRVARQTKQGTKKVYTDLHNMQHKHFPEPDGLRTLIVPRNQQNTNDDPWLAKPPPASATSWPIGAAAHNKAPTNSFCTKYASLLDLQCLEPLTLKCILYICSEVYNLNPARFWTLTSYWNPGSQTISWQNWENCKKSRKTLIDAKILLVFLT